MNMVQVDSKSPHTVPDGQERRAFRRHPTYLPAQVVVQGSTVLPCVIRDYCLGGMLVVFDSAATQFSASNSPYLRANDTAVIKCVVTTDGGRSEQTFHARIVRLDGDRAGVAFLDPDLSALQVLQEYVKKNPAEPPVSPRDPRAFGAPQARFDNKNRLALIEACNEIVRVSLDPLISTFQDHTSDALFEAAKASREIALQNAYFDALRILNDNKEKLKMSFLGAVDQRLKGIGRGPLVDDEAVETEISRESLSLVQDREFDQWLSVSDFVDSVETAHRELLDTLAQRLTIVFAAPVDNKVNPYGPVLFARSFQDAINSLDLKHTVLLTCYKSFKKAFSKFDRELYSKLNQLLVYKGVLPDLKHSFKAPAPQPSSGPSTAHKEEMMSAPAEASPASSAATQDPAANGATTATSGARAAAHGTQQHSSFVGMAQHGNQAQSESAPITPVTQGHAANRARDLYQLVGDLQELQAQLLQPNGAQAGIAQATEQSPHGSTAAQTGHGACSSQHYSTGELLAVLSNPVFTNYVATDEGTDSGDLRSQIQAILAGRQTTGAPKTIGQREGRVIDVGNNVFSSLLGDLQVAQSIRPWLKKLALPVLKMALLDDTLFVDKTHTVRQVVNKMSELEALADTDDEQEQAAVEQALEWLVTLINKEFDGTTDVFRRAGQQLDLLIKTQNDIYRRNLKQVVSECLRTEGETKASAPKAATSQSGDQSDEWLRRVRRLQEGHWVLFDASSDEPKRLKVAWIAVRTGRYVFVNALGKKDRVLLEKDLASLLQDGSAVPLDGADEPAMDRAQYSMLQRLHQQLLYQSTHDPLTGLINRREFEICLEQALDDAKVRSQKHALCIIDLDQFKLVNTTCGYQASDKLLQELAEILKESLAEDTVFARLGTDQFGILLQDRPMDDALEVLEEQMAALQEYRFTWNEDRISVSMSVGLATVNAQSENVTALIQAAESSCNVAKEMGGNRVQIYHAGLSRRKEEMKWAAKIDKALDENALHLRCQKIAPLQDNVASQPHYELLLGLSDELGGQRELGAFIRAAEHYNRMRDIDRWVIRNAFERISAHEDQLLGIASFSINLSGASLNDESLLNYITTQIKQTSVPIEKICFEITETAGITNLSDAADFINTIKSVGCRFSLDDFGSGMSSYAYLKNLPVDYLKIDGAFIRDIASNPRDYAVAKSICEIGHFMDKTVIAEYVQDENALTILKEIGVDFAQGYGIEEPQRLDALLEG
jgi:diguanylate cyclase (GGDEF)-like protein